MRDRSAARSSRSLDKHHSDSRSPSKAERLGNTTGALRGGGAGCDGSSTLGLALGATGANENK